MYLINKDIDLKIGTKLITHCNIKTLRILNKFMIIFKNNEFINGLYNFFVEKFLIKYKIKILPELYYKLRWIKINFGFFYSKALKDFASQKNIIIFDGKQKSSTRMNLYFMGMMFGYRHVINGQENIEKASSRNRLYYSENNIDSSRKYTMKELTKLRLNWGKDYYGVESWLPTDEFINGEKLWIFNSNSSLYKRGKIVKSHGILKFYKTINIPKSYIDNIYQFILNNC